jgi:acyl-coenzyme A synthetase/AMP-(fatty) acid ligase
MSEGTGNAMASTRPASRTLSDLVDEMAADTPTAEAVVFRDERLDYAGLKARVDGFARALLAVGIRHGDRVAVLVTNRTAWIVAALAAAKVGAIVAAISTFSTPRELAWMLEHSGAVALVTLNSFRGRGFLDALRGLCPELDGSAPGALSAARLPPCARSSHWTGPHPPEFSRCRSFWRKARRSMPPHCQPRNVPWRQATFATSFTHLDPRQRPRG